MKINFKEKIIRLNKDTVFEDLKHEIIKMKINNKKFFL